MASRCPHCTSELSWFGNDPRPGPDHGPADFGLFLKCCIAVGLVVWLVSSCTDHYYCDPAHNQNFGRDAVWRARNCG